MRIRSKSFELLRGVKDALSFVALQQSTKAFQPTYQTDLVTTQQWRGTIDVYRSTKRRSAVTPAILILPGLSPLGAQDPRIQRVAYNMQQLGFDCYIPQIQSFAALNLDTDAVDQVESIIQYLCCIYGEISVFAASFSATIAFSAASRPTIRDNVKAICSIGGFANVSTILKTLLAEIDVDPYGKIVILAHCIGTHYGFDTPIYQVAKAHALALWGNRSEHLELYSHIRELAGNEVCSTYDLLATNNLAARKFLELVYDQLQPIRTMLDARNQLPNLRCFVLAIHGISDDVIPASQLDEIESILFKHDVPSMCIKTALIGHGDTHHSNNSMSNAMQILLGFAHFFTTTKFSTTTEIADGKPRKSLQNRNIFTPRTA